MKPTLRPYQLEASDKICEAFFGNGLNRLLVKKPTGTGKTVWFASLPERIKTWFETFPKGQRGMLIIAHREELLDQAAEKILAANPGARIGIEQGDRYATQGCDVVIASIQTLSARKYTRLKRLLRENVFRLVIVDEAHHAAAASYRTTLVHLGFLPPADASEEENIEAPDYDDVLAMEQALADWDRRAPKDRLLIGVTATPNRTDAVGLSCVFQTLAFSYALKQAIDDQWLVPIVPWVVESKVDLDDVRITAGEFNQKDLAEAVNLDARNQSAVAAWQAHGKGRSTLAFTVDVAHAHALAEAFQQAGVRAEPLSGETPKDLRRAILRRFTAGEIEVITNCMVLTEGTDLPRTSCILHAKPTKSATLYEQMTGRGLRLFPGKADCNVIDIVDISRRHSLQGAPVLYGLPTGLLAHGKDLQATLDELAELKEQYPAMNIEALLQAKHMTLEQLRLQAKTFDIWAVPDMGELAVGRSLSWLKLSDQVYRLSYPWGQGKESLEVQSDLLGTWEIVTSLQDLTRGPFGKYPPPRTRRVATNITSADAALSLAETFVRQERSAVYRLKDITAPWRLKPATDKQLALLGKKRIPHNPKTITMGQASELIDLAFARRGAR